MKTIITLLCAALLSGCVSVADIKATDPIRKETYLASASCIYAKLYAEAMVTQPPALWSKVAWNGRYDQDKNSGEIFAYTSDSSSYSIYMRVIQRAAYTDIFIHTNQTYRRYEEMVDDIFKRVSFSSCLVSSGLMLADNSQKIYDINGRQVGTVKDGRIYDKDYRQQGTIKDGRVYDKNYRQKGTVR